MKIKNWDETATLARRITWTSSKQTYFTARAVVDNDLVDDFYRAYAYFRWADDIIDVSSRTIEERINFVKSQKELIDNLYSDGRPVELGKEQEILADLIHHDRSKNSGLQSFIRNMFAVISFDAYRKGNLVSQEELTNYIGILGKSVTDGLQYFIGNGHLYPDTENRYFAAKAAHITHLLRDMIVDVADGFINIPREYVIKHEINLKDLDSSQLRSWVSDQVEQARVYFSEGKLYLDSLAVLRCKIAGYWYCARFEVVLDAIERDDYTIRSTYKERRSLINWFKFIWLTITIIFNHILTKK
jgi:phytoene/squalene synthetase